MRIQPDQVAALRRDFLALGLDWPRPPGFYYGPSPLRWTTCIGCAGGGRPRPIRLSISPYWRNRIVSGTRGSFCEQRGGARISLISLARLTMERGRRGAIIRLREDAERGARVREELPGADRALAYTVRT